MKGKCSGHRVLNVAIISTLIISVLLSGCSGMSTSSDANSGDTGAVLIVTPAKVDKNADEMEDAELLLMFENILYPNGMDAYEWPGASGGIEYDDSREIVGPAWVKVTNVSSLDYLRLNYEAVFSKRLLHDIVYPVFIDGDKPAFKDIDGELFIQLGGGGGIGIVPDFKNAVVVSKNADSFAIETSLLAPEDVFVAKYTHVIVRQNDNWVLDTFAPFNQGEL